MDEKIKTDNEVLTYPDFLYACQQIAAYVKHHHNEIKNVFGIPRGGLVMAVYLSHLLDIPLVLKPTDKQTTLVADDICDTGKTAKKYKDLGYCICTIYYHKQSIVKPDYWVYEKKKKWVQFPWEVK